MKKSVKCYRKGSPAKPGKRSPIKPTPWWHDETNNHDSYGSSTAPVEDPDRYKVAVVNDPPLRKCF